MLAWFRSHAARGRGYQTEINRVLRQHVQRAGNRD
ncbi:BrnA antitoxin family protein [Roseicella aquatilis]|nr:BrnA antitoxin family protein [Roseicella aquatilis]